MNKLAMGLGLLAVSFTAQRSEAKPAQFTNVLTAANVDWINGAAKELPNGKIKVSMSFPTKAVPAKRFITPFAWYASKTMDANGKPVWRGINLKREADQNGVQTWSRTFDDGKHGFDTQAAKTVGVAVGGTDGPIINDGLNFAVWGQTYGKNITPQ